MFGDEPQSTQELRVRWPRKLLSKITGKSMWDHPRWLFHQTNYQNNLSGHVTHHMIRNKFLYNVFQIMYFLFAALLFWPNLITWKQEIWESCFWSCNALHEFKKYYRKHAFRPASIGCGWCFSMPHSPPLCPLPLQALRGKQTLILGAGDVGGWWCRGLVMSVRFRNACWKSLLIRTSMSRKGVLVRRGKKEKPKGRV